MNCIHLQRWRKSKKREDKHLLLLNTYKETEDAMMNSAPAGCGRVDKQQIRTWWEGHQVRSREKHGSISHYHEQPAKEELLWHKEPANCLQWPPCRDVVVINEVQEEGANIYIRQGWLITLMWQKTSTHSAVNIFKKKTKRREKNSSCGSKTHGFKSLKIAQTHPISKEAKSLQRGGVEREKGFPQIPPAPREGGPAAWATGMRLRGLRLKTTASMWQLGIWSSLLDLV